jgi:glycosyltransferase involved in cell wall biosynthesis
MDDEREEAETRERDYAPRVLHCPGLVGGNPCALARTERSLGLNSEALSLAPSPFAYKTDLTLTAAKAGRAALELARLRLLVHALRSCDIVHYNFGSAILPRLPSGLAVRTRGLPLKNAVNGFLHEFELALLRASGKRIFVTYQGCDARLGGAQCRAYGLKAEGACASCSEVDEAKRAAIGRFARYASGIYFLNPDLGWNLPSWARFVPYAHVDPREWVPGGDSGNSRPLVVHAPSNRGVKGTQAILEAVDALKREGLDFDFRLVENVPFEEARRLYSSADLLVDQLNIGWYGGLAVELMALGKPAMAFLRRSDFKFLPEEMAADIPVVSASAESVRERLRELVSNPERLRELGRRSRDYVVRWHDPLKIAASLKTDYLAALEGGVRKP